MSINYVFVTVNAQHVTFVFIFVTHTSQLGSSLRSE